MVLGEFASGRGASEGFAVVKDPSSVELSLGAVRENLMLDSRFMSLTLKDYRGELLMHSSMQVQHDTDVILVAVANGLEYCDIPRLF